MTERDPDFINERFLRVWDRFTAMDKAAAKADDVFEAYRHASNEARGTLADQANRFLPRQEYETKHVALTDQLNSLETRMLQNTATLAGRSSGMSAIGTVVVGAIASLVGLISLISVFVTLFHQPTQSTETQAKIDRLSDQVGQHMRKAEPPRKQE